jgi:hypothetical protein
LTGDDDEPANWRDDDDAPPAASTATTPPADPAVPPAEPEWLEAARQAGWVPPDQVAAPPAADDSADESDLTPMQQARNEAEHYGLDETWVLERAFELQEERAAIRTYTANQEAYAAQARETFVKHGMPEDVAASVASTQVSLLGGLAKTAGARVLSDPGSQRLQRSPTRGPRRRRPLPALRLRFARSTARTTSDSSRSGRRGTAAKSTTAS